MVDRKIIETVKSLQRDLSGWTEFNDSAVSTVDLKMNHQTICQTMLTSSIRGKSKTFQ